MEHSAGAVIADRYEVRSLLGRGGMAAVYLAHDGLLAREVALKMLNPALAADATFVERFRREAQAVAGLSHPNIVAVYDWGAHDGTYFMVMEYVAGTTLKEVVRRRGPRPEHEALAIGASVADALGAAHARGVVHRDVKPHNVLVDPNGNVKVTDFGIARAAGASQLTNADQVLGSASYASPEQIQRLPVDARSDLYSLGAVLYELLTGSPPFDGDSAVSVAWQHVHTEPPRLGAVAPAVSAAAEAVILRALAKRPDDRFQSAGEMRQALLDVVRQTAAPDIHEAPTIAVAAIPAATRAGAPAFVPDVPEPTLEVPADAAHTATMVALPPTARVRRFPPRAPETVPTRGNRRTNTGRALLAALVAGAALLGTCALVLGSQRDRAGQTVAAPPANAPAEVRGVAVTPEPALTPTTTGSAPATPVVSSAAQPTAVPTDVPTAAPTAPAPTAPAASATAVPPRPTEPPPSVPTVAPTAPPAPTTAPTTVPTAPVATAGAPTDAVLGFYTAAAQQNFTQAAAYWSPRMQAQYPPAENIVGRFSQTQRLFVNSAQVVSVSGDRATVAVDLSEVTGNPAVTQRWVGTWQLVRGPSGWLLDAPNLRAG